MIGPVPWSFHLTGFYTISLRSKLVVLYGFMMNNIKPLHIPIKVIRKHLRFLQFVHVLECPFKPHIHQLYNLLEMYSNAISVFFCSETLLPVKLL